MTEDIKYQVMDESHALKQPFGRRFALYCWLTLYKPYESNCEAKGRGGHLGDFEDWEDIRSAGASHQHPVIVWILSRLRPSITSY